MAKKKVTKTTKNTKITKKASANKKKTEKKVTKTKKIEAKTSNKFYDQLKLNESYVSLILGSVVVVAVFAIIFVYIYQTRSEIKEQRVLNSVVTPSPEPEQDTYIMQENESLWSVAVRFYGDGFSYIKIVEANPEVITNPDYVPPGTEIVIPDLSR